MPPRREPIPSGFAPIPSAIPKLDYQLNGGDWVPVDFNGHTDLINIASDSKPDLRFIAWIKVGPVSLQAGQNTIAFKFHSANNNHGSLDCFLFTQAPFTPNGKAEARAKSSARMNPAGGPSSRGPKPSARTRCSISARSMKTRRANPVSSRPMATPSSSAMASPSASGRSTPAPLPAT